jgi:hypothetical protein
LQPESKIKAFSTLGKFLKQFGSISFIEDPLIAEINGLFADPFQRAIREAEIYNPWFTREFMLYSFSSLAEMLHEDKLRSWLDQYPELYSLPGQKLKVGIIMAGNIPLVGFHDLLTCCISGHQAVVKMSSKDNKLLPLIYKVLCHCEPGFKDSVNLEDQYFKNIDAVIATGSNNSSRYFKSYFAKYPHIFRKNRNSVAILTGDESADDFKNLADDIFLYFGMGCRNVSKLFLPEDFNIPGMLDNFESYSYLYNHNKYANNYDYHKAIYLVNLVKHFDTGYLLLKEDPGYSSPVGIVFYEYYNSYSTLKARLEADEQMIQCIVSREGLFEKTTGFGKSQRPDLNDYADNVDTLKFLLNLYKK